VNCRSTNAGDDGASGSFNNGGFIGCELDNNAGKGINGGAIYIINCYIHDNGGEGVSANGIKRVLYSVFDSNVGDGCNIGNNSLLVGSIAYNNTGAAAQGFDLYWAGAGYDMNYVVNSVAMNNGQYGFKNAYTLDYFNYNAYYGNGTSGLNGITAGPNDITSDPKFTSAAGGDFTLQSDSPLIGAGSFSTIPGATGAYKWNIGVDQDDNTTGGGETRAGGINVSTNF
jgi:hypothetical protein